MIEIPPGASPPPSASSSSSANSPASQTVSVTAPSAVDMAKAAVQAKLEAVVQEVLARNPASQPDSKSWDVLLRLNPQASGTPMQTSSLTPDVMKALQAGQAVLLQTRAAQPLPVETRLQVVVSIAQGVQIQQLQPPALPPPLLNQLKQFIHQQQPLAPLLNNLLHLLQRDQQTQLSALPLRAQAAIAQVIATLPDPQAAQTQVKSWIENSGLLQEARLARALMPKQDAGLNTPPTVQDGSGRPSSGASAGAGALQQVRQQVQEWVQRLRVDVDGKTGAVSSAAVAGAGAASPQQPVTAALENDLKHQLQQLERHLQNAGATAAKTGEAGAKPVPPAGAAAVGANADPDGNLDAQQPGVDRKTGQPMNIMRSAESSAQSARSTQSTQNHVTHNNAAQPPRSPLAIQRYQASASTAGTTPASADATTPVLIPPLPGQVVVQAQPRAHASLKNDDMTDAIVKTLLAQVRGALARVTLHQLSSHSARQDTATPTSLSFEIPFLHNSQIEVFQFRIDEDTPHAQERSDKQQAKRWVVQLGFDIEGLGPMFCQLSLTGKSMAVQFWAAWEQTLTSTKAHFGFLEKSLQEMGVRVEKIQAQLGMPEIDRTGVRNQLVDIKT